MLDGGLDVGSTGGDGGENALIIHVQNALGGDGPLQFPGPLDGGDLCPELIAGGFFSQLQGQVGHGAVFAHGLVQVAAIGGVEVEMDAALVGQAVELDQHILVGSHFIGKAQAAAGSGHLLIGVDQVLLVHHLAQGGGILYGSAGELGHHDLVGLAGHQAGEGGGPVGLLAGGLSGEGGHLFGGGGILSLSALRQDHVAIGGGLFQGHALLLFQGLFFGLGLLRSLGLFRGLGILIAVAALGAGLNGALGGAVGHADGGGVQERANGGTDGIPLRLGALKGNGIAAQGLQGKGAVANGLQLAGADGDLGQPGIGHKGILADVFHTADVQGVQVGKGIESAGLQSLKAGVGIHNDAGHGGQVDVLGPVDAAVQGAAAADPQGAVLHPGGDVVAGLGLFGLGGLRGLLGLLQHAHVHLGILAHRDQGVLFQQEGPGHALAVAGHVIGQGDFLSLGIGDHALAAPVINGRQHHSLSGGAGRRGPAIGGNTDGGGLLPGVGRPVGVLGKNAHRKHRQQHCRHQKYGQ